MTLPKSAPKGGHVLASVCDLNGRMRGKMYRASAAEKLLKSGLRMPLSSICGDIWGNDVLASAFIQEHGDLDGICTPYRTDLLPIQPTAQCAGLVPLWMHMEDGSPFQADPRQALAKVLDGFARLGLKPVVASELEFYLLDPSSPRAKPVCGPRGLPTLGDQIYALDQISDHAAFLDDVYETAEACGIEVEAAISEGGQGQFEFNLLHIDDALLAADHAVYFKQIVKTCARKHDLSASFMAKPFLENSGCGFHVHFSLLDTEGRNVFDDGTEAGTPLMKHAVAGLIDSMAEMTLIFAPHLNSYRRMAPGNFAPTKALWGYENRSAALRIPGGPTAARRIEHRVAGADANPYLAFAAILGAALIGIEQTLTPPAPVTGNADSIDAPDLPSQWPDAVTKFETGPISNTVFHTAMVRAFTACKRQEIKTFNDRFSTFEYQSYLDAV